MDLCGEFGYLRKLAEGFSEFVQFKWTKLLREAAAKRAAAAAQG